MTSIKLAMTALVTAGLLVAPFAAEAKKTRPSRHTSTTMAPNYGAAVPPAAPPKASYGSSGPAIGTVTAPSIGSYNWPSVGVTNSVPTWSNTTR